ncbi:SURF1 family cytochrome oxidase biogenesis protein [Sphingomonas sp. PAMC 26621]|uniref:SURF1 family cytochrome oxidase biogenesis protein n=1 Tax=Sphingomonas sp. PAMC 26621 TaxID=1112213 RepID=UPI000288FA65|nr:SURF1 family cytochrome oxidase biogenesis protein [Sphingomonas sp. PAMC 26621]
MKRVPVFATILVALAIVAMVALGVWQLGRRADKAALLAHYARNVTLPPVAFPAIPIDDGLLFRRSSALCLEPVSFAIEGGRNARGGTGWRQIAQCRTGAEGPGFTVQLGFGKDPHAKPSWKGGPVRGYISHAPDHQPLIAGLFGSAAPKTLMLVADPPLAGLDPNPQPDLSAVPNNHLAYAVQWFIFAAIAAIIYALALRRRAVAESPAAR